MKFEKVIYSLITLLFLAVKVEAQERPQFFKKLSVGVNYGVSHLLTPKTGMNLANHISHNFLKGELRYMFNPIIGVSGHYAFTSLVRAHVKDPSYGTSPSYNVHRLGGEAVIHLSNLTNFDRDGLYQYFNVLLHTGLGGSAFLKKNDGRDLMFNVMIGLSPQIKLSEKMALKLDATYNANLKQDYDYQGENLDNNPRTGQIMNYSIGLQYYFGKGKVSADW